MGVGYTQAFMVFQETFFILMWPFIWEQPVTISDTKIMHTFGKDYTHI